MEELNPMQPTLSEAQQDSNTETLNTEQVMDPATIETATADEVSQPEAPIAEETPVTENVETLADDKEEKEEENAVDEPIHTDEQPEEKETSEEIKAIDNNEEENSSVDYVEQYHSMDRETLVDTLETLLQSEVQQIKHQVAAIRNRFNELTQELERANYEAFLSGGGQKEDFQSTSDAIAERFHRLYNTYRERRQHYQEQLEAQKKSNLEKKQQILEELRNLIDKDEESLKVTYDRFNEIQGRWKEIGEVPRESLNDLWQNYHFLIERFFSKVKQSKELRMLDLKRNLEQKIALCEKAEELMMEESIVKAFKELQDLRDQWREIGPVPTEHNEEIWQRFCNAAAQVDERRKAYYAERTEEMERNLLAKQALVAQVQECTAEKPTSVKQWNDITAQLDEKLKLWKTIGPVPHETNESIWNEFKGCIDNFYRDKKEFFSQMRDEQNENYNKKVDLCLKAEAIAKREDWKNATNELIALQEEWKKIGNVSRKVSDKIWKRFRAACDEFFSKKNEYFKDIRKSEQENLAKKEAIIEELAAFSFGDDKEENLRVIKDYQRQWMEIGHVPIKEKERLQKAFRSVIDGHFERLKISIREAQENAFREHVDHVRSSGGRLSGERQALQEKIDKLRSNLQTWENNLGFFSNSKQADLLRAEFEKKLQGARQQIALLETKLKIMDETEANKGEEKTSDE